MNSSGMSDKLFGGWQVNIIQTARSGFPFSVLCNCDLGRPSLIGDPFANVPAGRFMNAAAFSITQGVTVLPANAAGTVIRFGNQRRNTFRSPAIWNTDVSLFKNTNLTERLRMQLGIEFFNFWNHAKRTVPNNNAFDNNCQPVPTSACAFGRFDGFYPGRVIQYRAKLIF
jgi:hypothetical protein